MPTHPRIAAAPAALILTASCTSVNDAASGVNADRNGMPAAAIAASERAVQTARAFGRGINFGNMLDAPAEGAWGLSVTPEFIAQAWQAGFRTVRLPVRWSNHALSAAPYTIAPVFMARVTGVVDALLARGFHVVLDVHHYRQLDGDELDPGETAVPTSALDQRFVALWSQIAEHFRGRDERLVFELYNEPHGRLNGEPWNELAARALAAVRTSNPDRIVVIGPTAWNSASALDQLRLPADADLIVTIHDYQPFSFTHQGAGWIHPALPTGVSCCNAQQTSQLQAALDVAQTWSAHHHVPVFVGEFGAFEKADMTSRIIYTRAMRDAAEARGMSWAYWEFAAGFGVYDPATHAYRQGLLDALLGP